MIGAMCTGGRYASSGAIAGPEVSFNLRHLVYRDLEFHGSTCTPAEVFHDVVRYIEAGDVRPRTFGNLSPRGIGAGTAAFLEKNYIGKIVIEI